MHFYGHISVYGETYRDAALCCSAAIDTYESDLSREELETFLLSVANSIKFTDWDENAMLNDDGSIIAYQHHCTVPAKMTIAGAECEAKLETQGSDPLVYADVIEGSNLFRVRIDPFLLVTSYFENSKEKEKYTPAAVNGCEALYAFEESTATGEFMIKISDDHIEKVVVSIPSMANGSMSMDGKSFFDVRKEIAADPDAAKAKYNEFANDFVKAWVPDAELSELSETGAAATAQQLLSAHAAAEVNALIRKKTALFIILALTPAYMLAACGNEPSVQTGNNSIAAETAAAVTDAGSDEETAPASGTTADAAAESTAASTAASDLQEADAEAPGTVSDSVDFGDCIGAALYLGQMNYDEDFDRYCVRGALNLPSNSGIAEKYPFITEIPEDHYVSPVGGAKGASELWMLVPRPGGQNTGIRVLNIDPQTGEPVGLVYNSADGAPFILACNAEGKTDCEITFIPEESGEQRTFKVCLEESAYVPMCTDSEIKILNERRDF